MLAEAHVNPIAESQVPGGPARPELMRFVEHRRIAVGSGYPEECPVTFLDAHPAQRGRLATLARDHRGSGLESQNLIHQR